MALISIIIPIYNAGVNLYKCIDSVLAQTVCDIHVFLVNDGSTDDSLRVCEDYARADNRVTVINKENGGPSSARNAGMRTSKEKYLLFVDADDYITPDCCENLMREHNASGAELVIGGRERIGKREWRKTTHSTFSCSPWRSLSYEMCELYVTELLHAVTGRLYIRDKIKAEFDETLSLGEDLVFNLKYLKATKSITVLADRCYCYVIRESSISRQYRSDYMSVCLYLHKEALSFLDELDGGYHRAKANHIFTVNIRRAIGLLVRNEGLNSKEKRKTLASWLNNSDVMKIVNFSEATWFFDRVFMFLIKSNNAALVLYTAKLLHFLFKT